MEASVYFIEGLTAVEHGLKRHKNVVLFVGGLGDGLGTVPYTTKLAQVLDDAGWGLVETLTRSSYIGWGTGSLARDGADISRVIKYLRSSAGKQSIVLMGHSTGTQDAVYYTTQQYEGDKNTLAGRPLVQGVILQASVSDRQAVELSEPKDKLAVKLAGAEALIAEGKGSQVLTEALSFGINVPTSASRFVSLAKVRGGDDFFSSDLTDADFASTIGKITVPLLVLYSGNDEFVPETVDKRALVDRWSKIAPTWSQHSGLIPGATHNIGSNSEPGAVDDALNRVSAFISALRTSVN